MLKNKKSRAFVIGAAVLTVLAGTTLASVANAAVQPNGSQAPVYIGDPGTEAVYPAGSTLGFTDDTIGFQDTANARTPYVCPADSTGAKTFIAPKGQEFTKASWITSTDSPFAPGTKNNMEPTLSLYAIGANTGAVKSAGGDLSVGLACLKDNGVNFASTGVWFASIHVTAGTGAYTFDQPTVAGPTPTPTPTTPPTGSASLTLKATTAAAQDGVLSLTAPTNSTVLIGSPVVDPTTHLSTSTGKLGNLTVSDGRVLTHKGWNLTTAVTDFALETDATKTIPKTQLGFSPVLVSIPSGATGIVAAASQVAGSASYVAPFASADNSPVVGNGNTVLDANLTFVAPASAPAGTYDSTLTLTLTSK